MKFWRGKKIAYLKHNQVFVFGSNPEGRHGAGAAKAAMKFGAKYGIGVGMQGQSYAMVTKNLRPNATCRVTGRVYLKSGECSLTLTEISEQVEWLYTTASKHPQLDFLVTYQHTGRKSLCGYTLIEMLEHCFFNKVVPHNVVFHESVVPLMHESVPVEYVSSAS